jgi:hypothetical protein
MLLWYWRYIPCKGVKLGFDELDLYPDKEPFVLHLRKRNPKQKIPVRRRHIQEDEYSAFKKIGDVDFEIMLRSESGGGTFFLDPVHVFSFLLMIRTGGWINAPAILTSSILDEPDVDAPHIFCTPFIDRVPTHYRDVTLTFEDANWIKTNISTGLHFTNDPTFQNAMQALTSFH